MDEKLQALTPTEIEIGKPLPWPVYDKFGRLLLSEGAVVDAPEQIEALGENGLFRDNHKGVAARREASEQADSAQRRHAPPEQIEELTSVKLTIGDSIQLQDFSFDKQRHFVKLMGYLNKRSVLVSHPKNGDKLLFIKEGQSFLVRGFAGTKTYEFSSNVISVSLLPYPYLHLTFPTQVKTTSMRGAVRIKLRMVCSVDSKTSGQKVPATIEDMSISGARIHAKTAFGKVGDEVAVGLRMQIDGESQVLLVKAIIRNIHADTDSQTGDKGVMHGMQFVHAVSMELTMLQNFIYKSMLEN